MRIDAFRSVEDFKNNMDNWIQRFRAAKTVEGEEKVYIPGDTEREISEERMKNGIPIIKPVVDDLLQLADRFKTHFNN